MPSEHCLSVDSLILDQQQQLPQQVKLCDSCRCQLSPDANFVCVPCRDRLRRLEQDRLLPDPIRLPSPPLLLASSPPFSILPASPPSPVPIPSQDIHCSSPTTFSVSPSSSPPPPSAISHADPHTDITALRLRSQSHHCLYPGAQFSGTQKSGRSSYEVSVTIVDVDFSSSFLCGYLRIRGLTDDWPELTTYFDSQIIGSRYGFLTDDWGANEQEDMTHWARFPAFQKLRHELRGPRLTVRDRDRDCVFMRWKERFLVPDHRVRDINGASFAGFYYVCVEFNPQQPQQHAMPPSPHTQPADDTPVPLSPIASPTAPTASKPASKPTYRAPSDPPNDDPDPRRGTATMSGFYFHQNSEPYQHLSLRHVPASTTGAFEFR